MFIKKLNTSIITRRFISPIALLLCLVMTLSANANLQNITLEHLSVEDGLSQGTIKSIMQDQAGFIWFVTENGINIYDGYKFTLFNGPNGKITSDSISFIKEDAKGVIWISINRNGLYAYQPKTNEFHRVIDRSSNNSAPNIIDMIEDESGRYWVATTKSIMLLDQQYNVVSKIPLDEELTLTDKVSAITKWNDYLFIGSNEHILALNTKTLQIRMLPDTINNDGQPIDYNAKQIRRVFALHAANDSLYIGSNDGVLSLDVSLISEYLNNKAKLPLYKLIGKNVSTWSFYSHEKSLFVASETGLWQLDKPQKSIKHLFSFSSEVKGLSDDNLRSILVDKQGVFWLGSSATGVYKWDPKTELVRNFQYEQSNSQGLTNNEVWSILQDKNQDELMWVGTARGLNLVNRKTNKVEQFFASDSSGTHFSDNHIYKILYFDEEILYLNTAKGVRFFNFKTKQFVESKLGKEVNSLLDNTVGYIATNGDFWFASKSKIYRVNRETGKLRDFNHPDKGKVSTDFMDFLGFLPNSNRLLFTTYQALWTVDSVTGQFEKVYQHEGATPDEMLFVDNWVIEGDTFWFTVFTKGLIGLSLDDFKLKFHYHSDNSILDNILYGVKKDVQGDLWFSSHSGVYLLDAKNHHIRQFLPRNGFNALEFNGQAYETLVDGYYAFGSTGGVSVFDPIALKNQQLVEKDSVKITAIEVLSATLELPHFVPNDYVIPLSYDDVGIKVSFSTFNFSDNSHVRYRYKLTGDSSIEYPATYNNQVVFPHLASGTHILEVQAQSPQTGKFSSATRLVFKVEYAPWSSPVAYFLYIVITLVVAATWLIYTKNQRNKLLEVHEQVKQREQRLQLALAASGSNVWDWQADSNMQFSKRLVDELGYSVEQNALNQKDFMQLIHPDDIDNYQRKWQFCQELNSEQDTLCVTYRLKTIKGQWLWFQDFGKAVSYNGNQAKRIAGSYRNVTQSKVREERAQYYGEAFQNTQDWVVIVSDDYNKAVVNQAYCRTFAIETSEILFKPSLLGFTAKQMLHYKDLAASLSVNESWRGEDTIYMPDGNNYEVIICITASKIIGQNKQHYLFVFTDITAQKRAEKELRFLASYDQLTGLPNRSMLLNNIQKSIVNAQENSSSLALLFIDLDKFKQVNDSLGHVSGNALLKEVAKRLTSTLRANEVIARIGGDEFVVLVEGYADIKAINTIAQKLIKQLQLPFAINDNIVSIGASIGIATYPEHGCSGELLLSSADLAMYHAKSGGRNNIKFFSERLNLEASMRLENESNIKLAHANNEFINFYQPIVDAKAGKNLGVELLMRWQSENGLLSPYKFIPIAEELGLIIEMTECALIRGLKDLQQWQEVDPDFYLSLNLSANHFIQDSLVTFIKQQLENFDIKADSLRIEVTESMFISEPDKAIEIMKSLSELGVKLALDDFGTGYSSLAYLKLLPLDIIKLDRTFVSGLGTNPADEAIIESTLVLVKNLNMMCIAEGVETYNQRDYLLNKNCNFIQGFLYSKPVPAKEIFPGVELKAKLYADTGLLPELDNA